MIRPSVEVHLCESTLCPIDERQESLAHHVLASERVPAGVSHWRQNDRANAVLVLGFFRSPENVQLLKSLLDDPEIGHGVPGQLDYPLRAVACGVLSQWGVNVPKPITRVEIQEPWNGKMPPH